MSFNLPTVYKRPRIAADAVTLLVFMKGHSPPGASAVAGKSRPTGVSVVLLRGAEISHFAPPKSANNAPPMLDKDGKPIPWPALVLPCDGRSHWLTCFKETATVPVAGSVYELYGVTYKMYVDSTGEVRSGMSYKAITLRHDIDPLEDCFSKLSFEHRSVVHARDLPNGDLTSYGGNIKGNPDDHRLICIEINPDRSCHVGNNRLHGIFMPPATDSKGYEYSRYNTETSKHDASVWALMGGEDEMKAAMDNSCVLVQRNAIGETTYYCGQTKLIEDSILRFQVNWPVFAKMLAPNIVGTCFGSIQRALTSEREIKPTGAKDPAAVTESHDAKEKAEKIDFAGILVFTSLFFPDMAAIVKRIGFRLDWANCLRLLDGKFPPPLAELGPNSTFRATAINVANISCNTDYFQEGIDAGHLEAYAFTNVGMTEETRTALQGKSTADIMSFLCDASRYTAKKEVNIFICTTAKSPFPLGDYISSKFDVPPAFVPPKKVQTGPGSSVSATQEEEEG